MAIVHLHRGGFEHQEPDMGTPEVAPALQPLHPLETREGVLLLEQKPLPTFYDIGIDFVTPDKHRPDLDTDFGRYFQRDITFSDGTKRHQLVGVPNEPSSTVPIVKKGAWFTRYDGGFNIKTTDKYHRNGRFTLTEGHSLNRFHSLYRNGWDMHLSVQRAGEDYADLLQTEVVDDEGDSDGAMEATAFEAYDQFFGTYTRDGYKVDPALVRKIGRIDVKKFVRHPEYVLREMYCLGRQAVRLARDEEENIKEYVETVEFSKEFALSNIYLFRGLFWGEFGHVLAHLPPSQRGHYRLFEFSIANQKREFRSVLRGSSGIARQGVSEEIVPGTHLSIANPRTIRTKVAYMTSIEERLAA